MQLKLFASSAFESALPLATESSGLPPTFPLKEELGMTKSQLSLPAPLTTTPAAGLRQTQPPSGLSSASPPGKLRLLPVWRLGQWIKFLLLFSLLSSRC